jgi:hypothetical protein
MNQKPRAKFLVVCGATKIEDDWFMANLVGFGRAFQRLGADAIYLSSFPIDKYFSETTYTNIKFGRVGKGDDKNWKPIEVLKKFDYLYRNACFWTQYNEDNHQQMAYDFLNIIVDAAKELVKGDSYTIIMTNHGNADGLKLGTYRIIPDILAKALSKFQDGVQVNVVVQACHSGIFVDKIKATNQRQRYIHSSTSADQPSFTDTLSPSGRWRNSIFTGAFLSSLAIAVDKETKSWTLQGHKKYMGREEKTKQSDPSDRTTDAEPQVYTGDTKLFDEFLSVLFTEYLAKSLPIIAAKRERVLTPTNPAASIASQNQAFNQSAIVAVEGVIDEEISLPSRIVEHDIPIGSIGSRDKYQLSKRKITEVQYGQARARQLKALRWRFRIQESFYHTLELLHEKKLVTIDALQIPIQWYKIDTGVEELVRMLKYFERVNECTTDDTTDAIGNFQGPAYWLAIIMLRSSSDLIDIFDKLLESNLLGAFDREGFRSYQSSGVMIDRNAMSTTSSLSRPHLIGFWLPHNIDGKAAMSRWAGVFKNRYQRLKGVYEEFFGQGSWEDTTWIDASLTNWD